MIDIEAIRQRKVERSKPWEERPLALSFQEEIAEANADIDALLAEVKRLQTALSREIPHTLRDCACGHPKGLHDSVLLCHGCVDGRGVPSGPLHTDECAECAPLDRIILYDDTNGGFACRHKLPKGFFNGR